MHWQQKWLFGGFFHPDHAFLKLQAGKHDQALAALAFDLDICAHTDNFPIITAAWVLFFHAHNVAQLKFFAFQISLSP